MSYDCGDIHCPFCNPKYEKCPNCGFIHSDIEECPTLEDANL